MMMRKERIICGLGSVCAMGLAYAIFIYQDSIPKIGSFSIASLVISGLLGGAIYALLPALGIDIGGDRKE